MTKQNTKTTSTNQNTNNIKKFKDFESKSSYIRYLSSLNFTRSDIVKRFKEVDNINIRYQHVRNVLITPLTNKK